MTLCRLGLAAAILLATLVVAPPAPAADFMFRALVNGQELEGQPLKWTSTHMYLLGRDGQLHEFDPRDATNAEKTAPRFTGYSMPEMKRALYHEFGDSLDVSTTQHYIVVHPRGEQSAWANRFEDLYRSCLQYFRVRGFSPREPKFPLVAIVYRDQSEYLRAASAGGKPMLANTLGYYDPDTNRVYLFDITAGNDSADWSENAATIIHEATHQTAFNCGFHSRFGESPHWVVEGLATMFESRGVYNSAAYPALKDRINYGRLADFKDRVARGRPSGTTASLIASDQLFRRDTAGAYAEAWAFSFYLCETRPRQYAEYLAKTARRPMFSDYPQDERVADFQEVFGPDLKQLEANFLTWMKDIK